MIFFICSLSLASLIFTSSCLLFTSLPLSIFLSRCVASVSVLVVFSLFCVVAASAAELLSLVAVVLLMLGAAVLRLCVCVAVVCLCCGCFSFRGNFLAISPYFLCHLGHC